MPRHLFKSFVRLVAACSLLPTTAIGQVYLHSAREAKTTEALSVSLEAARNAQSAAFDQHEAELAQAITAERTALVSRELALRDRLLTDYLAEPRGRGAVRLRAAITQRLAFIVGSTFDHVPSGRADGLYDQERQTIAGTRSEHDADRSRVLRLAALDKAKGGSGAACSTDGTIPTGAALGEPVRAACLDVLRDYQILVSSIDCGSSNGERTERALATRIFDACWDPREAPPHTAPLVKNADLSPAVKKQPLQGLLGTVLVQAQSIDEAIANQALVRNQVSKALADLESHLACEQTKAAAPDATVKISAAAARIDALITAVETLDAALPPSIPPLAAVVPCRSDEEPPTSETEDLGTIVSRLRGLVGAISVFSSGRSIAAAARAEAQDFRASRLNDVLQAIATPADAADTHVGIVAAALARSAAPLETIAKSHAGKLPDTSGVLVAIAAARMKAAVAQLEADRLMRLAALAKLRIAAIAEEALLLRQGADAIGEGLPSERVALLFSDSVSRGTVPRYVSGREMSTIDYEVWSRRERAAAEAGYAILAPAAAQLSAYGAGGVKPEAIAGLLSILGLTVAAVEN